MFCGSTWRGGRDSHLDMRKDGQRYTELGAGLEAPSLSKGRGFNTSLYTFHIQKSNEEALCSTFKSKFKIILLDFYRLAEDTWAWLLTELIPTQDGLRRGTGLRARLMPWDSLWEADAHQSNSGAGLHSTLQSCPLLTRRENYQILKRCSCQGG